MGVILVGDPKQLCPVVNSQKAKPVLKQSLFERLLVKGWDKWEVFLKTQYRMHPLLRSFPSYYFYCNQLQDANSVWKSNHSDLEKWNDFCMLLGRRVGLGSAGLKRVVFINVSGGRGMQSRENGSKFNRAEAEVVSELWKSKLRPLLEKQFTNTSVGILSPYWAQVHLLRRRFEGEDPEREREGEEKQRPYSLNISTVDGFQGQERDIMVVSLTRTRDELGFLDCPRRMNVTLTRARKLLIVVGDMSFFKDQDNEMWRKWTHFISSPHCSLIN